ncbi:cell division protein ZipA C-terminal FtsZ-binding domain-containing protein [Acinetobacter gerneri]|uniref:Cell division protein ZipA n=1 Tax=Acinetobacter gerneri TaxID=202952 RepID=A0AAW8JFF2_9GAMM|nr:cell division protein ZipA C-terminal FtsZ-binding domain-containing protein [Acinetobacter gerneri]MDQ9009397.1 cell division protein ZipA C-terminal FtsZ-binding domain-containing protein [Acinetobacter gerneri]MDQ9013401.1 cell division protein ZipA C-terminal FtsZ-binding domain-containing protein [Acinetobacter gerneri]MDQ9024683.1 cell division protein ZipA C-terminal FtsZ-binding domain-containing protein [Acinetobacter gerneri]MDQ9052073.1 cell division protein ZipA C-terminal FtsZ-b
MEVTTIIGIVVAVIIILVGLRMIFRKSNDQAPSLESELHINSECQQPIIPRHVRDQLAVEESAGQRVEPNLDQLASLEVTDAVKTPSIETLDQVEVANQKDEPLAVVENSAETAAVTEKADQEAVKSSDATHSPEQETSEVAQNKVAETSEKPTEVTAQTTDSKDAEFSLNPDVEAAAIQEFEGESNILDVHLHEQQRSDDESILANAEQIIGLNLYPNPRRALSGDKTLKVLLKYGLRFGEMSCFHRYEDINEPSPLMFSVLRITDEGPAGFDLETLSTEQVNGLAFFLALPHPNVQKGFDTMASIAGLIAREIDGTVYDENNLEFTPQLKEHWRHQAIDYRSKQEA